MPKAPTAQPSEIPEAPKNRSGPRSISGGFQPAQKSIPPQSTMPPRESMIPKGEEDDYIVDQQPTTRTGYPDRRYKGQRDLPPPREENVTKARTGGTVGDIHVTIDKKPDRRYKENRSLSDEEVTKRWLEAMNKEYGKR